MQLIPYGLYSFAVRPFLFMLDAEQAHKVLISSASFVSRHHFTSLFSQQVEIRPVKIMGLNFTNRVGLAAGLDKNGEAIDFFGALGFGHIEVGTVTPKPQEGNPKPRMFRIKDARALINRMGFNNKGVDFLVENLRKRTWNGILGVSIGKNETTPIENAADDYLVCMKKVYPYADYIAVNVSCPNTKDLTKLQSSDLFSKFLQPLKGEQRRLADSLGKYVPLVVKISPDLSDEELSCLCEACLDLGIDGMSCTNTTVSREIVHGMPHAGEWGGLSGEPLLEKSTEILGKVNAIVQGKIPLLGVGGVSGVVSAKEKLQSGASLVQLYSSLVYRGPVVIKNIVNNL